jgi:acetyltransferase-like isoleucine patch superfamily enzyme
LIVGEISIGSGAWVCAGSFLHPGVTIGNGAVVGACSVVTKDIPALLLAAGNPCRVLRERELRDLQPGEGGGLKRGAELIPPAALVLPKVE